MFTAFAPYTENLTHVMYLGICLLTFSQQKNTSKTYSEVFVLRFLIIGSSMYIMDFTSVIVIDIFIALKLDIIVNRYPISLVECKNNIEQYLLKCMNSFVSDFTYKIKIRENAW